MEFSNRTRTGTHESHRTEHDATRPGPMGEATAVMRCIVCGHRAGYNRAVVDLATGSEIGGLCVGCECTAFGVSLLFGFRLSGSNCAFCERDGHYAIPSWRARTVETGGKTVSTVEYDVTEVTVRLCDEHLERLKRVAAAHARVPGSVRPSGPE